jgi:hypothetical protein
MLADPRGRPRRWIQRPITRYRRLTEAVVREVAQRVGGMKVLGPPPFAAPAAAVGS